MRLLLGDSLEVLRTLDADSVQCCVTSPPYWGLRDYGAEGQLGLETTPQEYAAKLVEVFREVRRVLKTNGTLWLVIGDCYASNGGAGWQGLHGARADRSHTQRALKSRRNLASDLKPKDLVGIPWLVAFALRADGWYLRSDTIWSKPNPVPESVNDRPTKSHEYVFLFAKSARYYYDASAVREPARDPHPERNRRSVWTVTTQPYDGAHTATYPPKLIRPCILAGSRPGDIVLDPFNGAGTTGLVALQLRRQYVGIDINPDYLELTRKRLAEVQQELFLREHA